MSYLSGSFCFFSKTTGLQYLGDRVDAKCMNLSRIFEEIFHDTLLDQVKFYGTGARTIEELSDDSCVILEDFQGQITWSIFGLFTIFINYLPQHLRA